jgi:uridylate kinase
MTNKPKRILLKLSWEALANKKWYWIDVEFLDNLAKKIVYLSKYANIQVVIVIWWWNIFRWVAWAAKWIDRWTADYMGMLATIMNGIALWDAIEKNWNEVRVMSAIEIPRVAETFIRRRALKHLNKQRVVICVAWTGNPYFTTDSAAVLRALELNCDFMVKWTKVDGVYNKDPEKHTDATKYDILSIDEALNKGLRILDQSAIALAKDEWLDIFVTKIENIDKIWTADINWTKIIAK